MSWPHQKGGNMGDKDNEAHTPRDPMESLQAKTIYCPANYAEGARQPSIVKPIRKGRMAE